MQVPGAGPVPIQTHAQTINLRERVLYRGGILLALAFTLGQAAWMAAAPGGQPELAASTTGQILASLLAFWGLMHGMRISRDTPRANWLSWGFLAAGALSMALGAISTAIYRIWRGIAPMPSTADVFFTLAYPLILAAILSLPRRRLSQREWLHGVLDVTVITLAAGLIFWDTLISPLLATKDLDLLPVLVSAAYPLGDLILLWAITMLVFQPFKRQALAPLAWLVAGLSSLLIADLLVTYQVSQGNYQLGAPLGLMYSLAPLLLMVSGLAQAWTVTGGRALVTAPAIKRVLRRMAGVRSGLPYIWLVCAYVVLVLGHSTSQAETYRTGAAWVALIITLVMMRQLITILDSERHSHRLIVDKQLLEQRVREHSLELERANKALQAVMGERRRVESALLAQEERWLHTVLHDSLTGLANRTLLIEQIQRAMLRCKRTPGYTFAVLFLDLDGFKVINDSLGHALGDQLLIAFANRLKSSVRELDMVARLGGDEFVILVDEEIDAEDAAAAARRVLDALSAPFDTVGSQLYLTSSMGVVVADSSYQHAVDILRDADLAMYEAKAKGRSRFEIFTPEMRAEAIQRMVLERDLRQAMERGEFVLHYQPIMELSSGKIVGFEALLRWQHPELGLVPPARFIPLAEANGMIFALTEWTLEKACTQVLAWQTLLGSTPPLAVSVNLSPLLLKHPDFPRVVDRVLEQTGLPPTSLKLEITENAVIEDLKLITQVLNAWRQMGVEVHLDDFGTGYSALSYLQTFPVDTLKIDRAFVGKIGANGENMEVVRTIVNLARELKLRVIAEGVETAEQMRYVSQAGCELAQGYYFHRPVEAERAQALLWPVSQGLNAPTHRTVKRKNSSAASAVL